MRYGKGSLVRLWYKTTLCDVEPVSLKEQRPLRKDERQKGEDVCRKSILFNVMVVPRGRARGV